MILKTEKLTKQYNSKGGCTNIDIEIEKPMIFGLLGPNGAGKSTLVKTLVGLLKPTSGKAFILGKSIEDPSSREYLGYLPENFRYHEWLSGYEVMEFHAQLYKIRNYKKRINELLEIVNLQEHKHKKVKYYSKGMQQRLGLAVSLINNPRILFLDEPTSALDPIGRIEIRNIIKRLKEMNTTVFLNSHLLSEVEKVCDKIAIIEKGKIITQGTLDELKKSSISVQVTLEFIPENLLLTLAEKGFKAKVMDENILQITLKNRSNIPELAKIIVENDIPLYELKEMGELEEVFIRLLKEDYHENDYKVFI